MSSSVAMAGRGAPARTAMATPERTMSARLPATRRPASVNWPMAWPANTTRSKASPACTRLAASTPPTDSTVTAWGDSVAYCTSRSASSCWVAIEEMIVSGMAMQAPRSRRVESKARVGACCALSAKPLPGTLPRRHGWRDVCIRPEQINLKETSVAKEILCGFGVDVDAVAGWLGSYGGEDSPDDISRGLFSGEVGSMRLLTLFERMKIKTSWFIPGHSIETFPSQMKAVADAGHEIGIHGYSHENPIAMTPVQEEEVLDKCIALVTQLCGKRPTGYVAPWWEFSKVSNELLLKKGIKYDHSLMHNDFSPYYVRVGDSWTKIDFSQRPADWMKPLVRGTETPLIEIPANWYLDDLPPMMFIKKAPNSHGFVNPRDIEQMWRDQFDWVYREMDYAVFPMTIHPDVAGRPQVLLMLERLFAYISAHPGVRFVTMDEMADDFARRQPFKQQP